MSTVTGYTADKLDALTGEEIISAHIDGSNHLILVQRNSTTIDVGNVKGADGAPGAAGAAGANGTNGSAGAAGNTILPTTGVPANAYGNNGDFAIDSAAAKIYGPKAGGTWPAPVTLTATLKATGNSALALTAVANGATVTGTIPLGTGYMLEKVVSTKACWIRLYASAAYRTADAARLRTADPTGDHGVIADIILTPTLLSTMCFPSPHGYIPGGGDTFYSVVNDDTTGDMTITFTKQIMEA